MCVFNERKGGMKDIQSLARRCTCLRLKRNSRFRSRQSYGAKSHPFSPKCHLRQFWNLLQVRLQNFSLPISRSSDLTERRAESRALCTPLWAESPAIVPESIAVRRLLANITHSGYPIDETVVKISSTHLPHEADMNGMSADHQMSRSTAHRAVLCDTWL